MKKKLPKLFSKKIDRATSITVFVIFCVLGFMIPWIVESSTIDIFVSGSAIILIIAALPIFFLLILIHELGHAFGGFITGQEFLMMTVGPLGLIKQNGRIIFKWIARSGLMGGCSYLPKNRDHFIRSRMILVLMGPLFIWISFFIFLVAGIRLRSAAPLYSDLFILASIIAGILALLDSFPGKGNGYCNDARQFIDLLKKDRSAEELADIIHLHNKSISGTRPRDLDEDILRRNLETPSANLSFQAVFRMAAYCCYLDSGDVPNAKIHLDKALENFDEIAKGIRQGFALEKAFSAAFFDDDLETAREWMKKSKGGFVSPHVQARAEAAIAARMGDAAMARQKIKEAREDLKKTIDKGGAYLEEDLLRQIEEKIKEGWEENNGTVKI